MVKIGLAATALAVGLIYPASDAATASGRRFEVVGSADQVGQINSSLAACPSLAATFDRLVPFGFQRIRVTTSDETKKVGPFLAAVAGNEIIVAADWLVLQQQPYFDVRYRGEILPDNLCFDFGHLADHVAHPPSPPTTGTDIKTWVTNRIDLESKAFLRSWPYVLEAARKKSGGKALNGTQLDQLLLNLRYRFAFTAAMDAKSGPKLRILADGSIPEDEGNVAAIAAVLSRSSVADLQ